MSCRCGQTNMYMLYGLMPNRSVKVSHACASGHSDVKSQVLHQVTRWRRQFLPFTAAMTRHSAYVVPSNSFTGSELHSARQSPHLIEAYFRQKSGNNVDLKTRIFLPLYDESMGFQPGTHDDLLIHGDTESRPTGAQDSLNDVALATIQSDAASTAHTVASAPETSSDSIAVSDKAGIVLDMSSGRGSREHFILSATSWVMLHSGCLILLYSLFS